MRIVSHNQWKCDRNNDAWTALGADCSAAVRTAGFARVYEDLQPDLIGCQEVSGEMADRLQQALKAKNMHYTLLWGRDTPILYRTEKFEVLDADFLIYPDEVPGFEGSFNNQQTKSWCAAVLREKATGKLLAFMTTHLWWKSSDPAAKNYQFGSDEARACQLNMAMDKLEELQKKYGCPAILVGDLNSYVKDPAPQAAFARGFMHAHDVAAEAEESCGMHHCGNDGFGPLVEGVFADSIDHILLKDLPEHCVARFARYTPDYYAPLSDHAPVYIDLEL